MSRDLAMEMAEALRFHAERQERLATEYVRLIEKVARAVREDVRYRSTADDRTMDVLTSCCNQSSWSPGFRDALYGYEAGEGA